MKENIEEDIEILEELQQDFINLVSKKFVIEEDERRAQITAIEHILSDYKRVIKENEELKDKWDKDTHKLQNDLDIANAEKIEIQKENEQFKHKYDKALSDVIAGVDLDNTYISKQKIKDILAKLKEEYKTELEKNSTRAFILKCQITILEDLLEEKGK